MREIAIEDAWTPDSLVQRVIRALRANDALELNRLLRIAQGFEAQIGLRLDESKSRLLASLLAETSRNLRLLQRVCGRADETKLQTRSRTQSL
jgi:hypothetical protein